MVFNLLEHHSGSNSDNISHLLNYFKKWKKLCENNLDKISNNKISLNYKKINIQNKNKKIRQNYERNINKNILSPNKAIKKADMEKVKYSKKPINEISGNKYVKINQSKNIYKTRYANTFRGSENSEFFRNDNIKIRYIDNTNKIISDNISDLSNNKYKFNSEIVYQKKILNYNNNQISNLNNDINCLHKSIISESKLNNYKNNNKIEEREVHFNSLSSYKNTAYKKIKNNNINIIYNDNFNIFDNKINGNKNKINKNKDIELKNKISKIKIISESINSDANSINIKDSNENNCGNLINKIKKLFSKKRKVINHKINQTFCCSPINLLDELD